MPLEALVRTLRKDLASGVPRSVAWAKVANDPLIRGIPPLRRLLRTFRRDLEVFERFALEKAKSSVAAGNGPRIDDRVTPARGVATPLEKIDPRANTARTRGPGRRSSRNKPNRCPCPPGADHRDPAVRRRHLWLLRLRTRALRDWARYTPEMRRARTAAATAARRRRKDQAVLEAVHPRLRKLLGSRAILERQGRRPPARSGV